MTDDLLKPYRLDQPLTAEEHIIFHHIQSSHKNILTTIKEAEIVIFQQEDMEVFFRLKKTQNMKNIQAILASLKKKRSARSRRRTRRRRL